MQASRQRTPSARGGVDRRRSARRRCGSDSGSSSDTTAAAAETTAAARGDAPPQPEAARRPQPRRGRPGGAGRRGHQGGQGQPDRPARHVGQLQGHPAELPGQVPGIENPVATPDASSADELTAVQTLAGPGGHAGLHRRRPVRSPSRPRPTGLWEPYKASTWDEIPDALKDPDGNWVGAYYGIMAIGTNTTIVKNAPKTSADLKKPEYKGQVYLNDDPREAGRGLRRCDGRLAGQRRQLRRHHARHPVLRRSEEVGQLRPWGRHAGHDPGPVRRRSSSTGPTTGPGSCPSSRRPASRPRSSFPATGSTAPTTRRASSRTRPTRPRASCGSSTSCPTRARSATSRVGPFRPATPRCVAAGKVTDDLKKNLPTAELIKADHVPDRRSRSTRPRRPSPTNWGPMVADA